MNRRIDHVTKIDVGTPPYASYEWETFEFHFHGFERLSTEKGRTVRTSKVTCFGHMWWLKVYPGGDINERAQDDSVSVFLCKSSNSEGISIKYKLDVLDWDGERTVANYHPCMKERFENTNLSWGIGNFMKRSYITDPSNNILVDGTLVVELRMKLVQKTSLPCAPFISENSSYKKMEDLYYNGGKYADVVFEFPREKEFGGFGPPKYFAHRAVLQVCAPGLAELCDPHDEINASIALTNVESEVFQLLLSYVYGMKISVSDWKVHSRDLIDAGDRFNVSNLKIEAEAWYVKFTEITAKNVIDLLLYADAKNCALLKERVMDYFVKNSKDSLQQVSFVEIPESRSLFTDLLLAFSVKNEEEEEESESEEYKVMRISRLRKKLVNLGLDTDGSREMLIKRLEMENKYHDEDGDNYEEPMSNEEESID